MSRYFRKPIPHALVMFLCVFYSSLGHSNDSVSFNKAADDIWADYQRSSPLSGSKKSDDIAAAQLPDISAVGLAQKQQRLEHWISTLMSFETTALSEQARINQAILLHRLNNELDEIKYKAYLMPLTSEGGFHTSLAFLPRSTQLKTTQDIDNYLSRLGQFGAYFKQQISWMKQGIKAGFTQPKVVLKGYEESIAALISQDPQQSVYFQPFHSDLAFLSSDDKTLYIQKAEQVIKTVVNPSYQSFYDFMVNEYIPGARDSIGIQHVPNGNAYYQNRAEHYTTTKMSAKQIHNLGLKEVARIKSEMETVIESVNFEGSFAEFLAFLRNDPQFYATSGDALLKEASYIAKKMDAQLPKLFKQLPRTPYGIEPVPAHIAPKYTTGRYVSPSKETDPGYYWVNTYGLDRRPLYELEALTLHEAVPGHHLQISLNKELKGIPKYRSSYYISAFGEGWGLYAEWLGLEVGFYQDPYSNFGRLTYEMWRATRLVVDTGMHVMGWTRQQAVDFMMENSALSEHNINTEVDRYISWPGQALSYKIGEIKIKQLRQEAEQALGARFDVREFHHQILKNGAVPLAQLEAQIMDYIAKNKA